MKHIFYYYISTNVQLLLIMQIISPAASLIESLCSGTGYNDLVYTSEQGSRDIGWNRLYAHNKAWTHAFWVLNNNDQVPPVDVKISFLTDGSQVLHGWLHLEISRPTPFHYLAVWALTENHEAYGNFIWDRDLKLTSCPGKYYDEAPPYIPCSAAAANSATVIVPGMFIYANLEMVRDASNNFERAEVRKDDPAIPRYDQFSLIWRIPSQDYCNRPKEFRFMIASTAYNYWGGWNKDWSSVAIPVLADMVEHSIQWGPRIYDTIRIKPTYFGHSSRHDISSKDLSCGDAITTSTKEEWIEKVESRSLGTEWFDSLWIIRNGMDFPDWSQQSVKARSTCQANLPDSDLNSGFNGRCDSRPSPPEYLTGDPTRILQCLDATSTLGAGEFKEDYEDYLVYLDERLEGPCECIIIADFAITRALLPPFLPVSFSRDLLEPIVDAVADNNEECTKTIVQLNDNEQTKAGICIHNKVGTLVYGVRQWHGVTSLGVTLIITPLSIFVARYNKGEMMLIEGKVPLKGWYISHILLVFPAIWMYASGFATISRQKDVIGLSFSWAAYFHRTLGFATFCLIPLQFVTGFLRPTNLKCRKVFIFVHWIGGMTQHILELLLCIFSSNIPASPTTSRSIVSPEFGSLTSSIVACLVIGWLIFSVLFHIMLMIRIKRQDSLAGVSGRSLFPIIIPLLTSAAREDLDLGHLNKDIWFERGALLIFSLVSCIVFAVSIVSLYQALHENLYYGFGPMTCTHLPDGTLVNSSGENSLC